MHRRFPPGEELSWLDITENLNRDLSAILRRRTQALDPVGDKTDGLEGPVMFILTLDLCVRDYLLGVRNIGDSSFFQFQYCINSLVIPPDQCDPWNVSQGTHEISWYGYAHDLTLICQSNTAVEKAILALRKSLLTTPSPSTPKN